MSKKHIIITGVCGLVCFAGMFAASRFLIPGGSEPAADANEVASAQVQANTSSETGAVSAHETGPIQSVVTKSLSEKQLKSLIFEVRERIKEYDGKLEEIQLREERLQVVQRTLKKDVDELNNLRVDIASMVANLKDERDKLQKARIEISQAEKANLVTISATYDKMDPASASKILANMCSSQTPGASNFDDAVKILFYMTERTKAKLLAEMVATEPKLTAVLCQKLKQITEGK